MNENKFYYDITRKPQIQTTQLTKTTQLTIHTLDEAFRKDTAQQRIRLRRSGTKPSFGPIVLNNQD